MGVTTTPAVPKPPKSTEKSTNDTQQSNVPVGLIAALILLCVLMAALIFLWVKYREHKRKIQERVLERMMRRTQADTESNGQTISRDTSKDLNKSESENLLYPTSGHSNSVEESLPSPISDTYDETSETKKCLDPIEEDGNQDGRINTKEGQYSQMYEAPEAEEDNEKERAFSVLEHTPENTYRNHRYSRRYNSYGGSYRSYHTRYHDGYNQGEAGDSPYTTTKINV